MPRGCCAVGELASGTPRDHPLRAIRPLVNAALEKLSPQFDALYASSGRTSIAPEKLLRAFMARQSG